MKKLTNESLENIEGGICALNPHTGECRPNVCFGLGMAFEASNGNGNLPLIACPL